MLQSSALPSTATIIWQESGVLLLQAFSISVCLSCYHFSTVPFLFASVAASTFAKELFSMLS
ncbi:hypothetical protein [Photorhabdus sp. CRCIA-P01]|uniref:hypothetical protein n=1 Tax=Photorhabdus sp. CRCIA-P01 TaxID=2019570 RepID=UPI0013006BC3|nr:hypothetical protein [Photorhabdus sp. CRCIA-P01]